MTDLSTTSAATEGFYVIKNNPAAVAIWALVLAVAAALAIGLIIATVSFAALSNLPALMEAARTDVDPDPAVALSFLVAVVQMMLIAGLIGLVVEAVLVTAVKRAVLRPEERSFGYMRVGGDELRTFLVRLVRGLIYFGMGALLALVAALMFRIHAVLGVLWCFAAIPIFIYVAVKLSLAVSQSFAERRFNVLGSWRLSRGHFWPLLGAYALAIIFYLIVLFVVSTIAGVAGGNALMMKVMEDPENFELSTAGPAIIIGVLIQIISSLISETFKLPLLGAAPAAAYRELATAHTAD